jgi:hypothetical protein
LLATILSAPADYQPTSTRRKGQRTLVRSKGVDTQVDPNTARMGLSDRSIRDYCERVWKIQPGRKDLRSRSHYLHASTMNATPNLAFLKAASPVRRLFQGGSRELANGSRVRFLTGGDITVRAGDQAHALGVILEGKSRPRGREVSGSGNLSRVRPWRWPHDWGPAVMISSPRSGRVMLVPLTLLDHTS